MKPSEPPPDPAESPNDTPYARLGGEAAVRRLVERFYDLMDANEPELAKLHDLDVEGGVSRDARDRFALFLIGWLGGPQTYVAQHGHPRLRMRHGHLPIGTNLRDAWLRCMLRALSESDVDPMTRAYLSQRFAEVADFLRNVPGDG